MVSRIEPSGQRTVVIIYQSNLEEFENKALRALKILHSESIPSYDCKVYELNTFSYTLSKISADRVLLFLDLDNLPETFHIDHVLSRLGIPRLLSIKVIAQTRGATDTKAKLNVLPPSQFIYTASISQTYSWLLVVIQHLFPYRH